MARRSLLGILFMAYIGFFTVGGSDAIAADQPAKGKQASALQRGDANGDGVLAADEAVAYWERRFEELDLDGDGKLSSDEYAAGDTKALEALDANKDGVIQVDEYVIYWCGKQAPGEAAGNRGREGSGESQFQKMDADKNGEINHTECLVFYTARFHEIDGNGDGVVSKEELAADTKRHFQTIDLNRDGSITVGEYRTYWIKAQQEAVK